MLCGEAQGPLSQHRRRKPTCRQAIALFDHSQLRNVAASMPSEKPSRKVMVDAGFMSMRRAGRRHSQRETADGEALSSFSERTRRGVSTHARAPSEILLWVNHSLG